MPNWAVEHNGARFSELFLAGREGQAEASIMSNSANLMSSC